MVMVERQFWKRHFQDAPWGPIAIVILLEVLFGLALLRSPGTHDVPDAWMKWIDNLLKHGIVDGFQNNFADYPPFASVILLFVAKAGAACSIDTFFAFKISLFLALLCTTLCFWAWTRDAAMTGLLAFSLFFNGVALCYLDTYFAPTLILSLWALQRKRLALFSLLFTASCLIKWQPLVIAPFLALHAASLATDRSDDRRAMAVVGLRLVAPALGLILFVVAVFGYRPIVASLRMALNHTLLSGNALNFNWLVTWFLHLFQPERFGAIKDGLVNLVFINPAEGWARAIKWVFIFFYLGVLWRLFKTRASFAGAIECALAGYLAYFVFNIGVHENHLFLATVLAAVLAPGNWLRAILIVAMSNLNLIIFYGFTGGGLGFGRVVGIDVTLIFATVNVLLFLYFWSTLVLPGVGRAQGDSNVT
jgi:hypothetical protein